MSDVLALCYAPSCHAHAHQRFQEACAAMHRLKGVARTSQAQAEGFLVARFASPLSSAPQVLEVPEEGVMLAVAGWCQGAMEHQRGTAPLAVLADAYRRHTSELDLYRCLEGQYAALCVETRPRRMRAWVDRLGLMPGYVYSAGGLAWFATSAMVLASVVKPHLDLHAVRTLFLGRSPNSPHSLFDGITRLGFGQHVELSEGRHRIETTWTPYLPPVRYRNLQEAIEEGVSMIRACCAGIRTTYCKPIMDLTSGLDSRLVVAAMYQGAGDRLAVTVSGAPETIDAQIAAQAAKHFGWELLPFAPPPHWGSKRWPLFQEGVALSEGELSGNRIDRTLRVKHAIRDVGGVAVTGSGGECYREFFWQQEFFAIGRTRHLNLARLMKYRFDFGVQVAQGLFGHDWYPEVLARDVATLTQITDLAPDALNTAKLDAIYLWKLGGHVGRYAATAMPVVLSLSPLLTHALVEYALSMPWQYRMHGRLMRGLITRLSPALAKLPTWYGSSAEPFSLRRPLQVLKHGSTSAQKLLRKLGQVTIGHSLFRDPTAVPYNPTPDIELTKIMQDEGLLTVDNLVSAGLYAPQGLAAVLRRAQQPGFTQYDQLHVVVSVELICRLCGLSAPQDRL